MKKFLTFCFIFYVSLVFSAKNHDHEKAGDYHKYRARLKFVNKPVAASDMENSIIHLLHYGIREKVTSALILRHMIESPAGYHFTFEQLHDNVPVYQSQIKVNTDKQPNVRSILRNDLNTTGWKMFDIEKTNFDYWQILEFQEFMSDHFGDIPFSIDEHNYWAYDFEKKEPFEALLLTIQALRSHQQFELLLSSSGIHYERDLNSSVVGEGNVFSPDSSVVGEGNVFNPDPLTSAHVNYGFPYIDNNDQNSVALENELQNKSLEITKVDSNSNYYLENGYVKIVETSTPVINPPVQTSPDFSFTRDEPGFEAVNALYHITEYQKYIQNCGFLNLVNYQIEVDVHALDNADQSIFQPGSSPKLLFGDGNVDDAEDADVIVHEYGHAVSYSAAPNTNIGAERTAIDEGFGDFVAASYSYSIDTFNWFKVFSWDGHNQYWAGRNANTNKIYPKDVVSSIHLTGEIWSSTLMDIFRTLGDTASKIIFQSMYNYSINMDMPTAAALLLHADTIWYDGDHFCNIYTKILKRGLTDTIPGEGCKKPSKEIVRNSFRFSTGQGPLMIYFPEAHVNNSIEIFDIMGRRIYISEFSNQQTATIQPEFFNSESGTYIIRVRSAASFISRKIIKVN